MKKLVKKWWFWVIVILLIGGIAGSQSKKQEVNNSPYISKYEWNINETKTYDMKYGTGDVEQVHYVLFGVENKDGDLQAGEYKVWTNNVDKSVFLLTVVDKEYNDLMELPVQDLMIPEFEKTEDTIKLEKGQYLYIEKGSTGSDAGKVYLEKK